MDQINDNYAHDQIYYNIKKKIITGHIKANESIPSIRELSQELQVSCGTVQKAYHHLKKDGLIYSVPGNGFFVSTDRVINQDELGKIILLVKQVEDILTKYNLKAIDIFQIMQNE